MELFLFFIICLIFSALFSGSEMAFVSVNNLKLRELADAKSAPAIRALRLKKNPQSFLTGILIANNIVNVSATAILTYWFESQFHIRNEWIVTMVMAPLLIIFGEMVPKDYCRLHGQQFLLRFIPILIFFNNILKIPTRRILNGTNAILKLLGLEGSKNIFVSEKEFRMLIEESTHSGVLGKHEKRLIDMILDFERTRVDSVMIPIDKVPKVDLMGTIEEAKDVARQTGAKMILVYEGLPSIVVGMVYVFDLLFEENEKAGLKHYLRSPLFLNQSMALEKAFLILQQKRQSYAVVTDARGELRGTVGIEKLLAH